MVESFFTFPLNRRLSERLGGGGVFLDGTMGVCCVQTCTLFNGISTKSTNYDLQHMETEDQLPSNFDRAMAPFLISKNPDTD